MSVDDCCEVDEIAGFGSANDCEHLVDRKLRRVQHRQSALNLERKETSVSC
jgi:hypothetical protein